MSAPITYNHWAAWVEVELSPYEDWWRIEELIYGSMRPEGGAVRIHASSNGGSSKWLPFNWVLA